MFVIRFNNGLYWCGYNTTSPQLRKAKIYNSIDRAVEAGDKCLKLAGSIRRIDVKKDSRPEAIVSYKILEVEIRAVKEWAPETSKKSVQSAV